MIGADTAVSIGVLAMLVGAVAAAAVGLRQASRAEAELDRHRAEFAALTSRVAVIEVASAASSKAVDALRADLAAFRVELLAAVREIRADCRACQVRAE